MYNLIENRDNYFKTSGILWLVLLLISMRIMITVFRLKLKQKNQRVRNDGTKNVKIRVPLKYRNNFRRTPKMSLII